MEASCREVRRTLEMETGGVTGQISVHLAACSTCRAHAELLGVLERVAPAPADEAAVRRIMAVLPAARWQRRSLAAWLPVAAGLALVVAGLVLLGGIPAAGVAASVPGVAGGFLGWLATWTLDALAAAQGGSDAARALAALGGVWLIVWLVATALGGTWVALALAHRRHARSRS